MRLCVVVEHQGAKELVIEAGQGRAGQRERIRKTEIVTKAKRGTMHVASGKWQNVCIVRSWAGEWRVGNNVRINSSFKFSGAYNALVAPLIPLAYLLLFFRFSFIPIAHFSRRHFWALESPSIAFEAEISLGAKVIFLRTPFKQHYLCVCVCVCVCVRAKFLSEISIMPGIMQRFCRLSSSVA